MTTLQVISENSSQQLGLITRADSGEIQFQGMAEPIFEQVREGKGWDDEVTFTALAQGGWSNGHVSVRAHGVPAELEDEEIPEELPQDTP